MARRHFTKISVFSAALVTLFGFSPVAPVGNAFADSEKNTIGVAASKLGHRTDFLSDQGVCVEAEQSRQRLVLEKNWVFDKRRNMVTDLDRVIKFRKVGQKLNCFQMSVGIGEAKFAAEAVSIPSELINTVKEKAVRSMFEDLVRLKDEGARTHGHLLDLWQKKCGDGATRRSSRISNFPLLVEADIASTEPDGDQSRH